MELPQSQFHVEERQPAEHQHQAVGDEKGAWNQDRPLFLALAPSPTNEMARRWKNTRSGQRSWWQNASSSANHFGFALYTAFYFFLNSMIENQNFM